MISTTARRRRKVVIPTPPVTAEPKPYEPSPEFTRAYSVIGEVGPIISRWEPSGATERATWLLPVHTITYTPRRAYTPRLKPNF